jgi:hypothetical protein
MSWSGLVPAADDRGDSGSVWVAGTRPAMTDSLKERRGYADFGIERRFDLPLVGRSKFAQQILGGGKCGVVRTPTRKIAARFCRPPHKGEVKGVTHVMVGLVLAADDRLAARSVWVAGTRPAMTIDVMTIDIERRMARVFPSGRVSGVNGCPRRARSSRTPGRFVIARPQARAAHLDVDGRTTARAQRAPATTVDLPSRQTDL